jgi:DNA-binding MarR family transcriptional regulator
MTRMEADDPEVEELMRVIGRVYSLYGVLRTHITSDQATLGLAQLDALVLGVVVHYSEPVTVAQIGRMIGYPRQSVQRAARSLAEAGLVTFAPNPRHKRAPLLMATAHGRHIERLTETKARELSAVLKRAYPLERARRMAEELSDLLDAIAAITGQKDIVPSYDSARTRAPDGS